LQQRLLDKGCGKPLETCFKFESHADYYVEKGMGRYITRDEAFAILEACDQAGLVPMPWISKERGSLCNCCGDCCGILRSLKINPSPLEKIISNYFAVVDPEACSGCATCEDRCQMDAIKVNGLDVAEVDLLRCIGCGLCVSTCPSDALSLSPKSASERSDPPETGKDYLFNLAKSRRKSLIPIRISKESTGQESSKRSL
jgi:ferredoxin